MGIYLQSQMAVFGGRIVLPNLAPKLLAGRDRRALGRRAAAGPRGTESAGPVFLPSAILACYLLADAAYLTIAGDASQQALLFGINKYYLFI